MAPSRSRKKKHSPQHPNYTSKPLSNPKRARILDLGNNTLKKPPGTEPNVETYAEKARKPPASPTNTPDKGTPKRLSFGNMDNLQTDTPTKNQQDDKPTSRPRMETLDDIEISRPEPTQYKEDKEYLTIRYWMSITIQAGHHPLESFYSTLREVYTTMQDTLGNNLCILPWDPAYNDSNGHPVWKKPQDLPTGDNPIHKEHTADYFGGFFNYIPMAKNHYFLRIRFGFDGKGYNPRMIIGRQCNPIFEHLYKDTDTRCKLSQAPYPCQAPEVASLGWLLYSSKNVSEDTFLPAVRRALNLPDTIAIGMQYRIIANLDGSKPKYDKTNPPPQAIHLEIDKAFAPYYQGKMAQLWKTKSAKRVNGCQFRLVLDMSKKNQYYRPITTLEFQEIEHLRKRQKMFTEKLRIISSEFINPGMLDHPIKIPLLPHKTSTLREFIMSQHPPGQPARRIFHNVDPAWTRNGQTEFSVVAEYREEAEMFITTKMIPLAIHQFGSNATAWFTMAAIAFHKSVAWDPMTEQSIPMTNDSMIAISTEDIWPNLQEDKDQEAPKRPNPTTKHNNATPQPKKPQRTVTPQDKPTTEPITPAMNYITGKDGKSFGSVFGRSKDDQSVRQLESDNDPNALEPHQMEITFAPDTKMDTDSMDETNADRSMSTAAKTTPSTRLKLRQEKVQNAILQDKVAELQKTIQQQSQMMANLHLDKDNPQHTANNPEEIIILEDQSTSFDTESDDTMFRAFGKPQKNTAAPRARSKRTSGGRRN